MITENGIVTDVNPSFAWVRTIRSGTCESCSSKDNCGTSHSGKKEMTVTVKNTLNVKKGDQVVIGLDTRPLLVITFLLYVFPVILLIAGALIGNSIAPSFNMNPSFLSLVTGTIFFCTAFFIIRKKSRALSTNEAYKPFLVRKKTTIIPDGCSIS
ncbi:MAG: Fis family transcriptional regulator [Desulfobacterales bacterium RIFOXYA12_FULL_46_15]|nr:MAG: Fis family transcriptional regulator [Desulfobacterales bacterium RIFOXYA12_FULL_46_15]